MTLSNADAYGVITAPDTVRFERLLPGPVERVWAYLTEAEKRRQWFAGGEMELKPGGKVELVFRHSEFADEPTPDKYRSMEAGITSHCEVTECDPPRLLGITWPGDIGVSEVIFELFAEGDDVRLVVTHKRLRDRAEMVDVAGGWHSHLAVLDNVLRGGGANRFWSQVMELEGEYARRFGA